MKLTTKTMTIKASNLEVSVTLPAEATIEDVLSAVEGMIIVIMGWKPKGRLDYVEEE